MAAIKPHTKTNTVQASTANTTRADTMTSRLPRPIQHGRILRHPPLFEYELMKCRLTQSRYTLISIVNSCPVNYIITVPLNRGIIMSLETTGTDAEHTCAHKPNINLIFATYY